MRIIEKTIEMQSFMTQLKYSEKSIGFVPTMGYLHEGHLSLLQRAKAENDIVVLSIFVNPLQFGANEDLSTYPRDFNRDEKLAQEAGVDIIFYPSVEEMYPKSSSIELNVTKRVNVLCGKSRPGHFNGVVTVLTKLFNLVLPTRAYFGMKDAQQVAVVEGLVEDFNFPIEIVRCPIIRESDGLAKSSRNVHLTVSEREEAVIIYKSLMDGKIALEDKKMDIEQVKLQITNTITKNSSGTIDYVEILSYPMLETVQNVKETMIIAVAVRFSKVRLIDNMLINI
ncbi:pantoate--beta-alanine ligase [Lottiidibacillus patelloidae]|uniref:Pantothenate synthetase n=1 Tax=Lottiidibacillus patelloidae TaxID=2670334 RepID=A0A263BUP8_9BACI|nr:pantoate--beta-alanine ligase [Lottiidibacillus patelloidae]OZM57298.1 pantoate--beta-alanine ligase [Lottiidibacillus patelloidae]